ncbi:multidrug effflux MFS transporter [Pseudomonas fulva]|nr:multidrug effflux MFS transporter [Pseudomonas fulva]MBF8782073.1 multidrug effflux MFS transporter [Pseudomonas fulva]
MTCADTSLQGRMLVTLLILMSMLGVFPLDVILPSFQALAREFSVESNDIAHSISVFAVGVAVSQCFIGPLSDRIGRKKLLLAGLLLSMAGAVGCSLASNYTTFTAFRVLQALGCGCFVLTQALVQDVYTGHKRNSMRILLTSASGLFISLSPLVGSVLQHLSGWQGSFHVFFGLAAAVTILSYILLREKSSHTNANGVMQSYGILIRDHLFLSYSALAALAFTCHFAFIVISPLLIMDLLGFSEYEFSLVFIAYGMAYVFGGFFATVVNGKFTPHGQIAFGLGLVCSAGLVLVCWLIIGRLSVASILLPMIICTAGTTITRPAATSCALERHPTRAGAAAALSNTMLFAIGGLASGLIALAEENLAESLGLGFIAVGLCGGLMIKWLSSHPPASATGNT